MNWSEYAKVADNFNSDEMLQYRFGPSYAKYHAATDALGNIPLSGTNGIDGPGDKRIVNGGAAYPWADWFAMSGQLAYVPDVASDPGMALANNGSVYCDSADKPVFDYRISSAPDESNPWQQAKDPAILQSSWKTLSGGVAPRVPVAVARSRYTTSVAGVSVFANGLIGVTSTGNDPNTLQLGFPALKLPAGKVPTAVAMTLNHEFILVTVWDTVNRKGQLAVIAMEGNPPGIPSGSHFLGTLWWWGLPNWPAIRSIKLLGYVDLPISAPSSIEATGDVSVESGRDYPDNKDMNLSDQTQRDDWYNNRARLRRSAHAGYAIIASRAEGKVAFVDLQPLFQYYRSMYFSTAAKYQLTTNPGMADNQWPYAFSFASEQIPKVTATISVPRPTAVAAGFFRGHEQPWSIWDTTINGSIWDDGVFGKTAYVATESGEMRLYNVGNLNSENLSKPAPTLTRTEKVGNNPIAISYGNQAWFAYQNTIYILARGDKALVQMRYNGDIVKSMSDSRMVDPVNIHITYNWRGGCGGYASLAVADYAGKQVLNYVPGRRLASDANGGGEDTRWLFGFSTKVPGRPFFFCTAEVM